MRKNTYRIVIVAILLAFAIPLSLSVSATEFVELADAEITAGMAFGPGSDCPLTSPLEPGYAWISAVEPVKATWTIYDPGMHHVTTITHAPAVKQKLTTGEYEGYWAYADRSSFTLPAFAAKGTWLAKCEYELADGSKSAPPISAVNPEFMYQGIPCTASGDALGNIFIYPWYLAGMKMPAYFWFPLAFGWVPLLILGILLAWTRSAKGVAEILRGAWNAGKEFKRTAKARA